MENEFIGYISFISGVVCVPIISWFTEFYEVLFWNHSERLAKLIKTAIAAAMTLLITLVFAYFYSTQTDLDLSSLILFYLLTFSGSQTGYTIKKRIKND